MRFKGTQKAAVLYPLVVLLAGTIGATSLTNPNDRVSYAAFVFMVAAFLVTLVSNRRNLTRRSFTPQLSDAVPLVLLAVWLYGFILGAALHNQNITRNFAGMTLYFVYFIFLVNRINKFDLLRCVLIAAALNASYMLGFFVLDKVFRNLLDYGPLYFRWLWVRSYYSETLVLLLAPIMLNAHRLWTRDSSPDARNRRRRYVKAAALLYIYVFAFLQTSLSKATLLAYFLIVPFVLIRFREDFIDLLRKRHIVRTTALVGALFLAVYPATHVLSAYLPESWQRFDTDVIGAPSVARAELQARTVRVVEARAIIEDLHFFGKGLGATLASDYSRDVAGYGFEQNYLNLMHKFGIFSALIFIAYIFIARRICAGLNHYRTRHFALASVAFFGCLVMAYGNPILMSPVMVAFQCIVLYWLRDADPLPSSDASLDSRGIC